MEVVVAIYQLTRSFPVEERYGLASQIQRAAVSIPANIAEGYGRQHRREYLHHLSIARGSLMEAETLLQIAVRLDHLRREQAQVVWTLLQETGKMLNSLMRSLSDNSTLRETSEEYDEFDPWTPNPEP